MFSRHLLYSGHYLHDGTCVRGWKAHSKGSIFANQHFQTGKFTVTERSSTWDKFSSHATALIALSQVLIVYRPHFWLRAGITSRGAMWSCFLFNLNLQTDKVWFCTIKKKKTWTAQKCFLNKCSVACCHGRYWDKQHTLSVIYLADIETRFILVSELFWLE